MDMSELMAQLRAVIEEAAEGECNMTAEGEECQVHGMEECSGYMEEAKKAKPDFLDVDGDGNKKEPMKKALKDKEEKEKVKEAVHITVDGADAEMFINRMSELAGSPAHVGSDVHADMCPGCGCEMDQCTCEDGCCDDCGEYDCQCGDDAMHDALHAEVPMENADHDHGQQHVSSKGEPVDFEDWEPERDKQRFVRSIGDNPLIKEDAELLFKKLKGDYRAYVAEAELARSNAGADSPLTANSRDEFDKDPFANEDPVIDGTHSPLSTIKRQNVSK